MQEEIGWGWVAVLWDMVATETHVKINKYTIEEQKKKSGKKTDLKRRKN